MKISKHIYIILTKSQRTVHEYCIYHENKYIIYWYVTVTTDVPEAQLASQVNSKSTKPASQSGKPARQPGSQAARQPGSH